MAEPLLGGSSEAMQQPSFTPTGLATALPLKRVTADALLSAIQQQLLKEGHFFHQNPSRVAQQLANQPDDSPLSVLGKRALAHQGSSWVEHVTKPQQPAEDSDSERPVVDALATVQVDVPRSVSLVDGEHVSFITDEGLQTVIPR